MFVEAKTFKKKFGVMYREIRGHDCLKKPRVKQIFAERRIRLKRLYEVTYREIRGYDI